ncbi:MAG: serine/threonine-protein kinase [Holophaga sp.]|nr:serine/threonine-protein kinase [Holophaga sp.]
MTEGENFPKHIGRYEIKALLGSGAMGSVYLAEDPRIKRKLAIKVVRLDTIRSEAERQEFLARFQREAEVSGLLNDPGIVAIYDVGDSELGPFLAMEYVPGQPLDAVIKAGGLALKEKLGIAAGLAAALDHAHSKGVVHRDVKPGNVMITADHKPKLMDFGIAKRDDASLTQTGTFLGTPSYASPEQIREGVATSRSDVFSFGVLVFELLSGSLPFPGTSINTILYKIVNEPPVPVDPPVAGLVPEGWHRTFTKVLAKNPQERHASCSAFVRELLDTAMDLGRTERMRLLGGLRPGDSAQAVVSAVTLVSPMRGKANRPWLWAAMAGGLAGVVLAAFLMFRNGPAQVLIDSTPGNATVLKAGKVVGATPLSVPLLAGDSLSLERKGFLPRAYQYRAGDAPGKLQLEPVKSDETLRTDPPGATVVLDAVKLDGVTPLKVAGWNQGQKHDLTFSKGGQGVAFTLLEGETPGSRVFTLGSAAEPRATAAPRSVDANAPGSIRFAGEYPVRVRLDGKDLGENRGGAVAAAPGSHRLELSSPRVYFKETKLVSVGPGQAVTVALPATVRLTVETFPNSGTVVLDGIPTQVESDGGTPITVARGAHTVTIQGHPGSAKPVDLQADTPLRFKL